MKIEECIALNSEGLIPGPDETEEEFETRAQSVKEFFLKQENAVPKQRWTWAHEQLVALYDFRPKWCSAIYSTKGLAPWQPAATWINVKRIYMIQLSSAKWVSWLIDPDELLAHEAVHAARAAFDEPKTEEVFAYLTSSAKWRQTLGPIFRRPIEALALLGVIVLGMVFQLMGAIWDVPDFSLICFLIATLLGSYWSFRLVKMRRRLMMAAKRLKPLLRNPDHVRAVLFRMSDEEIIQFARGQLVEKNDFRWRMIRAVYFK